jgi:hypothetical protein
MWPDTRKEAPSLRSTSCKSFLSNKVADNTNTGWRFSCAGNISGPHLFLPSDAPRYFTAIRALLGTYSALCCFQIVYTTLCYFENKARDRKGLVAESHDEQLLKGFEDLTDKQNLQFRYRV